MRLRAAKGRREPAIKLSAWMLPLRFNSRISVRYCSSPGRMWAGRRPGFPDTDSDCSSPG